ncbi:WhiB family transcriptional regulator [Rhodococcus sp. C26F]
MPLQESPTGAASLKETNWRLRARCGPEDLEVFFSRSEESESRRIRRERAAKDICAVCPVIDRCRDHALAANEPHGVWGGMSETDRRVSVEIGRQMRARSLHFLQHHRQMLSADSTDRLHA